MYFVKTPAYLKKIFSAMTWDLPAGDKNLYLTFDDGPTPGVTEFALDALAAAGAKATFFCLGSKAEAHPELMARIAAEGHAIGNHSYSHPNGWKTRDAEYLSDVERAAAVIPSRLFRPPYGRIKITQIEALRSQYHIVMWDVIGGDFDEDISRERCLQNMLDNAKPGSIIVLHDSPKSAEKMKYALPRVLEHFSQQGYSFVTVPVEVPA
jgi:peptidoglycan/xylan/chitin deacetylase (PgdA/CDA1 family)